MGGSIEDVEVYYTRLGNKISSNGSPPPIRSHLGSSFGLCCEDFFLVLVPSQVHLLREAMAWALEWSRLTDDEKEPLQVLGLDSPELMARAFAEDEPLESFTQTAAELWPDRSGGWALLHDLWSAAKGVRSTTPGRIAAMSEPDMEVASAKRQRQSSKADEASCKAGQRMVPPPGKPPVARWPTRRQKKLAAAVSVPARELVEDEERARWVAEIVQVAKNARFPVVIRLEGTEHAHLLGRTLCRGLRTGTLRKRARDAKRLVSYMRTAHNTEWPTEGVEVMDYLVARASEPCGKSILPGIQTTLYFFEKSGGVQHQDMLSKDPVIENMIEGLQADIVKGQACPVAAPREPIMFTAVRERVVLDESRPLYHRAYAWWKNVQSWATLRFSDHVGLAPAALRMSDGALRGDLVRTKTTGIDKKVGSRAFIVSSLCYVEKPSWLAVGYEIWRGFHFERDYFLPMPSADMQSVAPLEARYMDASAMSRALLSDYAMPSAEGESLKLLLMPGLAGFWSEHSPRHNVPSWAATVLDISEDGINLLGGWVQKGTAPRYVETAERRIRVIQEATAKKLREARGGPDVVDEAKLFHRLRQHMELMSVVKEDQEDQINRLRWSSPEADGDDSLFVDKVLLSEEEGDEVPRPNWDPEAAPSNRDSLPQDLLGQYAVSIGMKSGHRRLHILGGCFRVPELHYQQYELFERRPDICSYDDYCRQCWPSKSSGAADASDEGSLSSSSSEGGDV